MYDSIHRLQGVRLGDARYHVPEPGISRRVDARSAAIEVMTDLHRVPAATISDTMPLDMTRQAMILRGVRMLLVVDTDRSVKGLITASDLLGEQPVTLSQARGVKPSDLTVADIMTPLSAIEAFRLDDILKARVGDIVSALKGMGRQHALVIESHAGDTPSIRGIFSASQIARQMEVPPFVDELATTFAQIEAAVGA